MLSSFIYHCNSRIGVHLYLVNSPLYVRRYFVWDGSLLDSCLFLDFTIILFIESTRRIDILGRNILISAWLSPVFESHDPPFEVIVPRFHNLYII